MKYYKIKGKQNWYVAVTKSGNYYDIIEYAGNEWRHQVMEVGVAFIKTNWTILYELDEHAYHSLLDVVESSIPTNNYERINLIW